METLAGQCPSSALAGVQGRAENGCDPAANSGTRDARIGFMNTPVVFQKLEDELKPMMKYVRGNVLNAGCGHRDISGFLKANGAASVENCDLASSIPGAIISDLVSIPRPDNTYDTILCNAVLEHVQFPDRVV